MPVLTEEQVMLKDMAQGWAQEQSPVTAFRKMRDSGVEIAYDAEAWKQMAEMGLAGVIIPTDFGGSEFGYKSLGLVLEETGKTLTASPLIASSLAAASALILGGTEAQKAEWLPKIADGSLVATLAVDEGPRHAPEKVATTAAKDGEGWSISGAKSMVLEGMAAGVFVVSASVGDGASGIELFLVPADAAGVSRERLMLADSRGAANVTFKDVKVTNEARLEGGHALLEKVLDRARAGLAAEMLGAATQAFDNTVEYLKVREQFGHVIGAFQALQHRAAKMLRDLELARSAVQAALEAIDADSDDVPELVSIAKVKVGDTFHLISNEMVQMHGGIGMTDAHDAGFYLKRARAAEALFGNQAYHRDRFARLNGY